LAVCASSASLYFSFQQPDVQGAQLATDSGTLVKHSAGSRCCVQVLLHDPDTGRYKRFTLNREWTFLSAGWDSNFGKTVTLAHNRMVVSCTYRAGYFCRPSCDTFVDCMLFSRLFIWLFRLVLFVLSHQEAQGLATLAGPTDGLEQSQ
ncbi:MAG: hypothetical protein ACRERX_09085, partial [Pseudomonas sp.]